MDRFEPDFTERVRRLDLQLDRPHSARMYDFFLGGKDNYAADRDAAIEVVTAMPNIFMAVRENRAFMHRATRMLAEHGIRQWLDLGTGIPTHPNLHEIAQDVAPDSRVVYVDNDPLVLAHGQALLTSSPEGRTAYIDADVTDTDALLGAPELEEVLDLSKPVAVSMNALLHFITDEMDPYGFVRRLMDELPSGSALQLSHVTGDFGPEEWQRVVEIYGANGIPGQVRSREEVERFFSENAPDLAEPGIVVAHRWRPDDEDEVIRRIAGPTASDFEVSVWAGVGFKP